jgi:hypothetical protein
MPNRRLLATLPAVLALCALPSLTAGAAGSTTLTFAPNVTAYSGDYGEPGLSFHGSNVYATTPGSGGAVWAYSRNSGLTWTKGPTVKPPAGQVHGAAPGSDSDVAVGPDGTVYVGDLTIDGIEVSRSNDGGVTFPQQVFVDTNATADREWLAVDGTGDEAIVYVAWHELATGTMLLKRSTDGGKTFDLTPTLLYSEPTTAGESARNGTSIGQISTDHQGHVYISYGVTRLDTTNTAYVTLPISQIIVASSADYGKTWQDVPAWPGYADSNYGNFWMATAVDSGGTVYAVFSGRHHDATDPMQVYLIASSDHGATWTQPYVVSPPGGNSLFGWVAGGGPGVAVVAWYHTDATNKDTPGITWVTQVAQVRGLASGPPTVYRGTASDHVMHTGGICTFGILCGVIPDTSDDRSLLDFFKVAVAPDGMAAVVFSDNGDGRHDVTYAKQNGGPSAFAVTAQQPPVAQPESPAAQPPPASSGSGPIATTGLDLWAVVGGGVLLLLAAYAARRRAVRA